MKTKTRVILALLFAFSQFGFAQQVKWGGKVKEFKGIYVQSVVHHDSNETIVYKSFYSKNGGYAIEKYDANQNFLLHEALDYKFEGQLLWVEDVFESNGKIWALGSLSDKKLDKRFLFVQTVNRKTLKLEGKPRKIAELNYRQRYTRSNYNYSFSNDSSLILVYANYEVKKEEPDQYSLTVFDPDFNKKWFKKISLPYSEKNFFVEDFSVDNNGNVFLLGVKFPEKGEEKPSQGKSYYEYLILSYTDSGQKEIEYAMDFEEIVLIDMMLDVSPKKDIICAGFYSDKGTSSIKGTFFLRIDRETKAISKISKKEFGMDFLTMNLTENQKKKLEKKEAKGKSAELKHYDLSKLIQRADGGVILIGEQKYITVQAVTDANGRSRTNEIYHFNNIIVVSISPDGEIEWATNIPKKQKSSNDYGYLSSYILMQTNDTLFIIYNDHKANLDRTTHLKNYGFKPSTGMVTVASIDDKGQVERRALMLRQEYEIVLIPEFCFQLNPKELFLFGKEAYCSKIGIATF